MEWQVFKFLRLFFWEKCDAGKAILRLCNVGSQDDATRLYFLQSSTPSDVERAVFSWG
jgi:hypothetical protein